MMSSQPVFDYNSCWVIKLLKRHSSPGPNPAPPASSTLLRACPSYRPSSRQRQERMQPQQPPSRSCSPATPQRGPARSPAPITSRLRHSSKLSRSSRHGYRRCTSAGFVSMAREFTDSQTDPLDRPLLLATLTQCRIPAQANRMKWQVLADHCRKTGSSPDFDKTGCSARHNLGVSPQQHALVLQAIGARRQGARGRQQAAVTQSGPLPP
ncbi:hypothetical protein QJQ45_024504 [Haematococcus lacustris]|nr:hypothetical protein QJQ45_024504 [Haematococcus lacustris]